MNVLTVNAGSSSIKFKIFRNLPKYKVTVLLEAQISNIHGNKAVLAIKNGLNNSAMITQTLKLDVSDGYGSAIRQICQNPIFIQYEINTIINRVVHGGDEYKDIVLLHAKTLKALSKFNDLAPLHQPFNLQIAEYFMQMYPKIKHYACFDTAFHQTMPLINRVYAIPWQYEAAGVKRYGFHGLSYEYISNRLPALVDNKIAKNRWVIAHLGGGSSICGIKNAKSVATSMGFSAIDGVPMATRCGELDPAIPGYLADKYKLTDAELNDILYNKSGLLGLSNNISGNMEELIKSRDPQAKFAVEYYALQVASFISKIATLLGGLDGVIFTGGIGENSPQLRSQVIARLKWLGMDLSKKANNNNKLKIHKKDSLIKILVVPTNEELAMVNQLLERNQ